MTDIAEAVAFIQEHHRGILATTRRDGKPQLSPVLAVTDAQRRVAISSRESAYKTRNLLRVPFASLCMFEDKWYGKWVQVEGPVEVLHLPDALDPLIDYYRTAAGETDWQEYRERMMTERRVLIRLTVARAGPSVSG